MFDARVSCVIPVYNGERYVGEAIESVLTQTFQPLDLIVVDDGSQDETARVVRSFGDHLTYVHQENAGPAVARNRGIAESSGDYLSFLDADDLWVKDKTERQLEAFRSDEALDYCIGGMENFNCGGPGEPVDEPEGARVKGAIDGYTPITLLVSREYFEFVGPFDPTFPVEDWEWFVRAHDAGGRCHVIQEVVALRRIHAENRTTGNALAQRQALLPVLYASLKRRKQARQGDSGRTKAAPDEG